MNRYTFEKSHALDRVIAALQKAPATQKELEQSCFVSQAHIRNVLIYLRKEKRIHISQWRRNTSGKPTPTYAIGSRRDAPRPIRLSAAEKHKAYRSRMREKLGDHYKHFIYALENPQPGRQIVIDGKVVWEQRA